MSETTKPGVDTKIERQAWVEPKIEALDLREAEFGSSPHTDGASAS